MNAVGGAASLKETTTCVGLILSKIQGSKDSNLDFQRLRNLYREAEIAMERLTASTENQLLRYSVGSILEIFEAHKRMLNKLQNTCSNRGAINDGAVRPWRRLLLFGPPGTGKTSLARALAHELHLITYNVSSAAVFSSWIGESEKLIRDLFEAARSHPSECLLFFDEIDAFCRRRSHSEDEHSRRVKTELLRQLEWESPSSTFRGGDDPLILAATNCPWDIDPAFLRRFQRRIYVELPKRHERQTILKNLLKECPNLSSQDWESLLNSTEGFSGADLSYLANAAAMVPIRELYEEAYLGNGALSEILPTPRPVEIKDFTKALQTTQRTVNEQTLAQYKEFEDSFH